MSGRHSHRAKLALYAALLTLAIPFLFPTWWMVTSSLKPVGELLAYPLAVAHLAPPVRAVDQR